MNSEFVTNSLSSTHLFRKFSPTLKYAAFPGSEHPMGIHDGLPPPYEIIPTELPSPFDYPEDSDDVEIEVPLAFKDEEVSLWPEDQEVPLEPPNSEIVIISDDEDDEPTDHIIEDLDDDEGYMSTEKYEPKEDPNNTPYTPRIHSHVTPVDPHSSRLRSKIVSLPSSSMRKPTEISSSPEYVPEIPLSDYTPASSDSIPISQGIGDIPEYTPLSHKYTLFCLEYTPLNLEYTPTTPKYYPTSVADHIPYSVFGDLSRFSGYYSALQPSSFVTRKTTDDDEARSSRVRDEEHDEDPVEDPETIERSDSDH